jgi:sodium/hydrogen exchanger 8
VYGCAWLMNRWREPSRRITKGARLALWHSGLRGGVAFALALAAVRLGVNK